MRECLKRELEFRTSRSSGPGGQHVNKTESRVELLWSPQDSACLSDEQKKMVVRRMKNRISNEGILHMHSEKYRSQHRNRAELTERFLDQLVASLVPVKKRRATRPTRSSVEKRIQNKKMRGEIKRTRRKGPMNN